MTKNSLDRGSIERVLLKNHRYKRLAIFWNVLIVFERGSGKNCLAFFLVVPSSERRFPLHHFIEQNTQTPDIEFVVSTLRFNHFRCHVFNCATKCFFQIAHFSRPAKITDLDISFVIEQEIFWLYISVNNLLFV